MRDELEQNMYDEHGNEIYRHRRPLEIKITANRNTYKDNIVNALKPLGLELKASSFIAGAFIYIFEEK